MTTIFNNTGSAVLEEMRSRTLLVGLGAMKSGTSWLSEYLASHPDFYHSPVREMNYFNRCYPNPFKTYGKEFRAYRIEEIIFKNPDRLNRSSRGKLRALAQLGRLSTHEDFLYYFAERMKSESHFGEISPANSHIPAEGLLDILTVTDNVKIVFQMRDPTERAASHIQHLRRRLRKDKSIDEIIETIDSDSPIFHRSDYRVTLKEMDKAQLGDSGMTIFYEEMFQEPNIRRFCDWLGLSYIKPDFDKYYNAARGDKVTELQKQHIRERLESIYSELAMRFGENQPAQWRW